MHLDAVASLCGAVALDFVRDLGLEVLGAALVARIHAVGWGGRDARYLVVDDVGDSGGGQGKNGGDLHGFRMIYEGYEGIWGILEGD